MRHQPPVVRVVFYYLTRFLRTQHFTETFFSGLLESMGRIVFTLLGVGVIVGATAYSTKEITVIGKSPAETITSFFSSIEHPFHQEQNLQMFLILGKSGDGWTAGELTDTILLAIVEPKRENDAASGRVNLLSIPRDLLVALDTGATIKINALWEIGKQEALRAGKNDVYQESLLIREKIADITGIMPSNVIVVDVAGSSQVIDALGGITINITERIDDPAFPTPGGGIEHFILEPGFHVLDGQTAIKYARTRHTRDGDFGRIRRQQQVIEATVAKARGLKLTEDPEKIVELYRAVAPRVNTTIGITDIPEFASLVTALIPSSNIHTFALETLGPQPLLKETGTSTLLPKAGAFDYTEIRAAVAKVLE